MTNPRPWFMTKPFGHAFGSIVDSHHVDVVVTTIESRIFSLTLTLTINCKSDPGQTAAANRVTCLTRYDSPLRLARRGAHALVAACADQRTSLQLLLGQQEAACCSSSSNRPVVLDSSGLCSHRICPQLDQPLWSAPDQSKFPQARTSSMAAAMPAPAGPAAAELPGAARSSSGWPARCDSGLHEAY